MTTQDRIAHAFLRALGAPDTPAMRAAVKAWLRAEGISSVKRNNPWNLHQGAACGGDNDRGKFCPRHALPGQIGVVNVSPSDKNVAVFSTLDAGVAANANNLIRLQGSGYGYDRVIKYARKGDAQGFLNALARSSWSAGRYGTKNGGKNKLIVIYNSITGINLDPYSYKTAAFGWTGASGGGASGNDSRHDSGNDSSGSLGAWGNLISFPKGHVITVRDVDAMMKTLEENGFFTGPGAEEARARTRTILMTAVGKKWDKALQNQLAMQFAQSAKDAADPLSRIADSLGAVGTVIAKLGDPGTWVRILALGFGAALFAYGGVNVYRATA